MSSTGVSGVAISVVQNGTHEEFYFGNASPDKPVDSQTLFEVGSITKVLTPHLMLVAQEEGKVSIHDPVSKHIPELGKNAIFNQITLKDLAHHISGLPGVLDPPRAKDLKSRKELMTWLLQWKPLAQPGSQYTYSNIGIALIGFALEKAYGQDWESLLKAKVLLPRKMESTFQNVPAEKRPHVAQGFGQDKKPADLLPEDWVYYPAGALKSTASNLGSYLSSWNEKFFQYLNENVCFSNHSCQGLGIEMHPLADLTQTFTNVEFTVGKGYDPTTKKEIKLAPLDEIFIDKTGSADGMSAYIAMIPKKRLGVVVLCNQWNVKDRITLGRKILQEASR
jgi:beta-lactamase class C